MITLKQTASFPMPGGRTQYIFQFVGLSEAFVESCRKGSREESDKIRVEISQVHAFTLRALRLHIPTEGDAFLEILVESLFVKDSVLRSLIAILNQQYRPHPPPCLEHPAET